jgi:GT2 family glycosyltransferase
VTAPPYGRWVPGNDWTQVNGQTPEVPPRVTVIVLHHNQPAELARTLSALERQRYPQDRVEIVVSDDGSDPAPELPAGVRLVARAGGVSGRSAARNRGVRASTGELLVFLDSDTAPEPEFLTALTRLPAVVPEAVTVGRRRHADLAGTPSDAPIERVGPGCELASPAWLSDGYAETDNLLRAGPRSFRFIISAVLCVSRWCFDEVGGFDESFRGYGGEDWEWARRAWLGGAVFAHEPGAVAWHDGPEWAARSAGDRDRARRIKNAEAIRLSGLIDVPGHRPRGLASGHPQAVIELDSEIDPDCAFITVDGLLAALPVADVRVAEPVLACCHGDPRVRLQVDVPIPVHGPSGPGQPPPAVSIRVRTGVLIDPPAFRALCERLGEEDVGTCRLSDGAGTLLELESNRHRLRCARWGGAAGLAHRELRDPSVQRLSVPPDVEAYLGGWRR